MHAPAVSATPGVSQTKHDGRLASLDGLRGLAALTVFLFHGWLYTMPLPDASNRSSFGDYAAEELRLGLVLFFVLSGFLLSRPWYAAALDGRRAPDVRRYALSRVARIAPAYYAALIGSIVLLWGLAGTPGVRLPPAGELPLFFVFGQNFSASSVMKLDPPMWSLAVEVGFYLLLPVAGWLALRLPRSRRAQALVPLALLVLGISYNWAIAGRGLSMTYTKTLAAMLPYFAVGMLGAIAAHARSAIGPGSRRALLVAGLALVLADATTKAAVPANGLDVGNTFSILRDLPSAVGFAIIIATVAATPSSRILGSRLLSGLGAISYGFYLWHVPVLLFMRGHGLLPLDPVLGTLTALGPVVAVSALSWVAIERPVIEWARRRNARGREAVRRPASATSGSGGGSGVDRRGGGREVSTVRT
ncbi:MAG TPA: acyltransferase [Solirubrobacteraceae bacterium]|nr:acyltransferase [Solirubrobacteraceae bacterium]